MFDLEVTGRRAAEWQFSIYLHWNPVNDVLQ